MSHVPDVVQAALHRHLIDQTKPLVIAVEDIASTSGLRVVDGSPSRYGYKDSALTELYQHLRDIAVGTMTTEPLLLPLIQLPTGYTVNLHWVPDQEFNYFVLTDADVCNAELRERQQAANDMTLKHREKEVIIHDLKQLQIEYEAQSKTLVAAQRFQRRLIEALAHDLRTPLTSICGYTALLATRLSDEKDIEDQRALKAIERAALVLGQTCENMLQMALSDHELGGDLSELLDLDNIMQDVDATIRPMAEAKGLELITEVVNPQQRKPRGFRVSLLRVLINLLSNAVRYTHDGQVAARIESDGEGLSLRVVDTGQGIAQEYRDSIFEPLNQGAQNGRVGTGLGLSIVRDVVRSQGGNITLESEVGGGSRFLVRIPEAHENTTQEAPSRLSADVARKVLAHPQTRRRALVVEDDATIAELLVWVLRETGFTAFSAENATEGRRLVKSHDVELLLTDIELGRDSGLRLIQDLRMEGFSGTAIVVSGSVSPQVHRAALHAGADAVFSKPLDLARFRALLADLSFSSDAGATSHSSPQQ